MFTRISLVSLRLRFVATAFGGALAIGALATPAAAQGNKALMTIRMAETMATRAIVESVVGLKLRSTEAFFGDRSGQTEVDARTRALVRGVDHGRPKYDPDRDIAMVEASLELGEVGNVIGKTVNYDNVVIKRVGFGTNTPAARPFLNALRAAEIDAYDRLARKIVGQEVESRTRTQNLVLVSDEVRTSVMAAVWGATITDYGWLEDSTAYVEMELDTQYAKDVMGNEMRFDGSNVISVTGYGAQFDETRQSPTTPGTADSGKPYDTFSLDLPTQGEGRADRPETGAAATGQ
jgi:hypothetical protein